MKLLIDIPKEFEQHFQADRFDDSLHRLSADAHLLAGLYEQETALMLSEAFKNAVPVPPHGRLIDGDVAEAICFTDEDADGGKDFIDGVLYAADFISQQPTVIPAEEGE